MTTRPGSGWGVRETVVALAAGNLHRQEGNVNDQYLLEGGTCFLIEFR